MIFVTYIHGIRCQCEVLHHTPAKPMQIHGTGFGDAHPPEPEEFEFRLLDEQDNPAPWLERHINPAIEARLLQEYRVMKAAEYYEPA